MHLGLKLHSFKEFISFFSTLVNTLSLLFLLILLSAPVIVLMLEHCWFYLLTLTEVYLLVYLYPLFSLVYGLNEHYSNYLLLFLFNYISNHLLCFCWYKDYLSYNPQLVLFLLLLLLIFSPFPPISSSKSSLFFTSYFRCFIDNLEELIETLCFGNY